MNSTLELKKYITSTGFEMVITTSNNKDMLAQRKKDNSNVAIGVDCDVASFSSWSKYARISAYSI